MQRASAISGQDRVGELRYVVFGRVVPGVFFLLLGLDIFSRLLGQIHEASRSPSVTSVASAAQLGLYFLFVSVPVLIYVVRPRPRAQAQGLTPRVLAFVGTFGLLFFPLANLSGPALPTPPAWVSAAAVVGLIFTTGFGLYGLLYLRRSFSIIPEARGWVRGGPYRFVRHPLYAGEISSALLFTLSATPHLWTTLLVIPFIAIQYLRTRFEEQVLTSLYPGYAEYATRVGRFFPRPA